MNLNDEQERNQFYRLLASVLDRNKITLTEMRQNKVAENAIASLMELEAGLSRFEFEKLVAHVSIYLATHELNLSKGLLCALDFTPAGEPNKQFSHLPTLDQTEKMPDGKTRAMYGKWL
ncbi:hypothetical protein A3B05_00230 [Candidatus Giovannonibacteria bacterium RIFCSPLOWO2_01_FULL_43_160]|uniref:Uncharacterized protein n=2 Tax=Candidatus Giovannoniibacteriota TaxID=1752738 RepID=A0A0G1LVU1_9BACT|nr:MAG: hypothetical protein UV72_C0001G0028 [Candidatus Giovannonibacteria bacterium GW2011_GWB1_43_13]KKS99769.1 MAG: hypothetical protein UV75_C0002G0150 [Candidatus Giovannonibacteria bacterium GW2011_GWA1_43_15]KKT20697.1 MAG: hypothetical protein UW05_C0032G0002 [Candidatus Giovannonibacteria bacterium GW2011_GWC2_43_8]KKT63854.1 MAG: hypothetical protein UW55_C0001G0147 [Candidatus Giovannonibacteria bacterium GW2011_GWA2_44_26]OGF58178.1 MAG: hypothetical protein A2652_02600 [Candidatus